MPVSIESLAVVENCKSGRTFAQDDFSVIGMRSADFGIAETSQVLKKTEGKCEKFVFTLS